VTILCPAKPIALANEALAPHDAASSANAQPEPDRSPMITSLPLPDPLTMADGTKVTSEAQWREKRRPELLRLFEENKGSSASNSPSHKH
jgi:hypothetical protein